jgi:hydroxymethylpyrimidine/phosphomethylpyrimidine kinase
MRVVLTIAGSDSGGGAGIQADLKTFSAYGVFGTSAITAVTAQNTRVVSSVQNLRSEIIAAQIDAVADDLRPDAVKTGMLANSRIVQTVSERIAADRLKNVVVDPVMIAKSKARLLNPTAVRSIVKHLLPLAALVTPNVPEAEVLSGMRIRDAEDMHAAATVIHQMGPEAVLVKGGHLKSERMLDLLYDGRRAELYPSSRIETTSTHGTGCTLSSAIAAGLALGWSLARAVEKGIEYTHVAIRKAPGLGRGHGPLRHDFGTTPWWKKK